MVFASCTYTLVRLTLVLWLIFFCGPIILGQVQHEKNRYQKADTLDAIIVPGIAYEPQWFNLLEKRVLWSWILYRNGHTKNVIFSGGAVHSPYYECRIMGLMAEKLGIPKERIFYDSLAEHSVENVLFSVALAKKKNMNRIALATDPVQSFFLRRYIRRKLMSQIPVLKMNTDSLRTYGQTIINIDPRKAMVENPKTFQPLRERQPFLHRRSHTAGNHISDVTYLKILYPGRKLLTSERRSALIKYLRHFH